MKKTVTIVTTSWKIFPKDFPDDRHGPLHGAEHHGRPPLVFGGPGGVGGVGCLGLKHFQTGIGLLIPFGQVAVRDFTGGDQGHGQRDAHQHRHEDGEVGNPPHARCMEPRGHGGAEREKAERHCQQYPGSVAGADVQEELDQQGGACNRQHDPRELLDEIVDRSEQGRGLHRAFHENHVRRDRDMLGQREGGVDRLGNREGRAGPHRDALRHRLGPVVERREQRSGHPVGHVQQAQDRRDGETERQKPASTRRTLGCGAHPP